MVERFTHGRLGMVPRAWGEYVRFSDYEALRAENKRLTAELAEARAKFRDDLAKCLISEVAAEARAEKAVEELERLREATNRKKVGQAYLVGGSTPRAIVDHAISALDLSMMRHDMIEDLKAGRVKPALASLPKESADAD